MSDNEMLPLVKGAPAGAGEESNGSCERKRETIQKICLKETVIVEGRYDRVKLSSFVASPIIETGGFRVFKDKEKQQLIRAVADRRGILIMTDVDSAGFVIRNFLRGIVPQEKILHAYIPTVKGKERRKSEPSKEGTLGVEGIDREALIQAILNSGAHISSLPLVKGGMSAQADTEGLHYRSSESEKPNDNQITKLDLFTYGLSGSENSAKYREALLSSLGLPKYLTANAMLSALNCLFTKDEFEEYISKLNIEIK